MMIWITQLLSHRSCHFNQPSLQFIKPCNIWTLCKPVQPLFLHGEGVQFYIYLELLGAAQYNQSTASSCPLLHRNNWSNELRGLLKGTLRLVHAPHPDFPSWTWNSNLHGNLPMSCVSSVTLKLLSQLTADDKWQLSTFPMWRKSAMTLPLS